MFHTQSSILEAFINFYYKCQCQLNNRITKKFSISNKTLNSM
jgi:hypothetical protein